MNRVWLVLDCNAIAHRTFHAMGRTGGAFGLLRDVCSLMDLHNTERVVFCFDHGRSKRVERCPGYKSSRIASFHKMTPDDQFATKAFKRQLAELRDEYLPLAGFRNVLHAEGFEADDVIASVVLNTIPEKDQVVIVSSDDDLYQLLAPNVVLWRIHKNQALTLDAFVEEWKVSPKEWALVKAIAGGHNDIEGVENVAERTASKYVAGLLSRETIAHKSIESNKSLWWANLLLTRLPYEGTPIFSLRQDSVTPVSWRTLCSSFGIKQLRDSHPVCRRKGLLTV